MKKSSKKTKGRVMAAPVADSGVALEERRKSGFTWAALAATVALAVGALAAGCGGGGDEETTPPAANGTTERDEQEPGAEAGEEADEGEGEPEGGTAGGIDASAGNPNAGSQIFSQNCAVCHGAQGGGGATGPDLQEPELAQEEEAVVTQIVEGGGGMPAFGEQLSDQEIADVAAFVIKDVSQR